MPRYVYNVVGSPAKVVVCRYNSMYTRGTAGQAVGCGRVQQSQREKRDGLGAVAVVARQKKAVIEEERADQAEAEACPIRMAYNACRRVVTTLTRVCRRSAQASHVIIKARPGASATAPACCCPRGGAARVCVVRAQQEARHHAAQPPAYQRESMLQRQRYDVAAFSTGYRAQRDNGSACRSSWFASAPAMWPSRCSGWRLPFSRRPTSADMRPFSEKKRRFVRRRVCA